MTLVPAQRVYVFTPANEDGKQFLPEVPAFLPFLMSSCIAKITHLCETYDSASPLQDQNYLYFRWDAF
jgi:hypothetical protein